ncbi:CrcB family protein [Rothia sp. AR01]|uniref:Fluoride-specific ion channel FluC n=1 Tax=Rothia santali TaxID=2949643 RepID=A0A9X2KLP8_9MICC|nr:CrcB family protein [Rothia santali]MCP3426401.1 CrcB family protein [Rothia santali]
MALVFLGAALGVSAREALVLAFPAGHGVPWAVLGINVTGSFALGLLLDALARGGPDRGRRRAARLSLGTGLIGGYTTYSALATDAAGLIGAGSPGPGLAYALATLLAGGVATWLGMAAATLVRRPGAGPAEGAGPRRGRPRRSLRAQITGRTRRSPSGRTRARSPARCRTRAH